MDLTAPGNSIYALLVASMESTHGPAIQSAQTVFLFLSLAVVCRCCVGSLTAFVRCWPMQSDSHLGADACDPARSGVAVCGECVRSAVLTPRGAWAPQACIHPRMQAVRVGDPTPWWPAWASARRRDLARREVRVSHLLECWGGQERGEGAQQDPDRQVVHGRGVEQCLRVATTRVDVLGS